MSWEDTVAVVAVIQQVPAVATRTFASITPGGVKQPLPYVIVHPADGNDQQTRLAGPYATTMPEFTLHIVGGSYEQASAITALIKTKFKTAGNFIVPTVTGRVGKFGWWRSPLPAQIDTDVVPPLVYQVIQLGWTSDPA